MIPTVNSSSSQVHTRLRTKPFRPSGNSTGTRGQPSHPRTCGNSTGTQQHHPGPPRHHRTGGNSTGNPSGQPRLIIVDSINPSGPPRLIIIKGNSEPPTCPSSQRRVRKAAPLGVVRPNDRGPQQRPP